MKGIEARRRLQAMWRDQLLPFLQHHAMRYRALEEYRRRATAKVRGRVLEIGIGSGLNLPFYSNQVDEVVGLDPSPRLLERVQRLAASVPTPVHIEEGYAERLPFEPAQFDAVLITWSLCSISDPLRALQEARRVLRPEGLLAFVEHGRSPEPAIARWQRRLTPFWAAVSGGCHLDRHPEQLLREAGFVIEHIDAAYLKRATPMSWMVEGSARLPGAIRAKDTA